MKLDLPYSFKLVMHICLFANTSLLAQKHYLAGTCTDTANQPIPFVKIMLRNSPVLANAGNRGDFGLLSAIPADSATFFADGYDTTTVWLQSRVHNQVILRSATFSMNEKLRKDRLSSLIPNLPKDLDFSAQVNGESYSELIENPFVEAAQFPETGFSPNSNRASYSNVRRILGNRHRVPAHAVRIEEMLNYFSLSCATAPAPGKDFTIESRVSDCPWNPSHYLLYINALGRKVPLDSVPPANLVFLIDNSGSMDQPNRLPLLKTGFKMLVENLRDTDRVAIVTYGGAAGIMLPPTKGNHKKQIMEAIEDIRAGGTTPGANGIQLAYELVTTNPYLNGNNRVIIATDGDFNVGISDEKELEDLILRYRRTGVYLTCLGVGMGNYKDSKIETLARHGNGNFAYLDSEEEAEKVLVTELAQSLFSIAAEAVVNVSFNRDLVKSYRLLGYDNRREALADSSSSLLGGDIGSGHSMVAIFEWSPVDSGVGSRLGMMDRELGHISMKYKPATDSARTVSISQPVRFNYLPLFELERSLQLAATVSMAGLMLRGSLQAEASQFDLLQSLAARSVDPTSKSQVEFQAMIQQMMMPLYLPEEKRKKGKRPQ